MGLRETYPVEPSEKEETMTTRIAAALALTALLGSAGDTLAQSCPANSTLVSTTTSGGTRVVYCVCNSGYVMSGGQCVRG